MLTGGRSCPVVVESRVEVPLLEKAPAERDEGALASSITFHRFYWGFPLFDIFCRKFILASGIFISWSKAHLPSMYVF